MKNDREEEGEEKILFYFFLCFSFFIFYIYIYCNFAMVDRYVNRNIQRLFLINIIIEGQRRVYFNFCIMK